MALQDGFLHNAPSFCMADRSKHLAGVGVSPLRAREAARWLFFFLTPGAQPHKSGWTMPAYSTFLGIARGTGSHFLPSAKRLSLLKC